MRGVWKIKNCVVCKEPFVLHVSTIRRRKTCSLDCRNMWFRISLSGDRNPNFGRRWSLTKKKRWASTVKQMMQDPKLRWLCGTANRGKKFDIRRRKRMAVVRIGVVGHPHTEESKRKIGIRSKEKFTEEYRRKIRKTFEDRGIWVPLSRKSLWELYAKEANWLQNFKVKKGLDRDHRFSRRDGFIKKVFPEILRHPVNCEFMTRAENCKKMWTCGSSIPLEQLFAEIRKFNGAWKEHKVCLEKIGQYERGLRFGGN